MPDLDIIKPHRYDGIAEYDNDLPRWWMWLLILSVVWSVFYCFAYHVIGVPLGADKLAVEVTAINKARAEASARDATGPLPEEVLRNLSHSAERVAKGKALFANSQCATCHGPDASGLVGPNLRDDWWIYGSDMSILVETITGGRLNGAMPPQGRNLSPDEIINLACFLAEQNRTSKTAGKAFDPAREKHGAIDY